MAADFDRCCVLWADATAFRMRQARRQADLPAMELHAALSSMSPDTDVAARVVVLTAGGDLAGATCLSAGDVERLRLAAEDSAEAHTADSGQFVADVEAYLQGGGA